MSCPECQVFKEHFLVLREGFEKQKLELEGERRARQDAKLDIDRLQSLLDENNDALKQLEHDRDSIAAQYNILKDNADRIEDHAKARRLKGSELNKIRADSEKYIHALEAELRGQTSRVRDLTDRLNSLQHDHSSGAEKHGQLHSEAVALRERCKGLDSEVCRLEKVVDDLQADAVRKAGDIHKLQMQLEEQHSEVEFFKEEQATELDRENKRRDKTLQERTAQNAELVREREELTAAHGAAETSWRLQMQREREDYQGRINELGDRAKSVQDEAARVSTDLQHRIDALRSDLKAVSSENQGLREQRRELEEQRAEITAKCLRLERAEAYARQEGRLVMENSSKARQELDRAKARISESKDVEARAALLEVRLQYKEQELQEARHEKEAMHLERGKVMQSLQKVVDKEVRKLRRCKKEQAQIMLALNESEVQRSHVEHELSRVVREFESFKKNVEVRAHATAALSATPSAKPSSFTPDPAVFKHLTDNYQKTADLGKLHSTVPTT